MKQIFVILTTILLVPSAMGQEKGNATYKMGNAGYQSPPIFPESNIQLNSPTGSPVTIIIKSLANIKADSYVAVFSVMQNGKTAEETNSLLDGRINEVTTALKDKPGVEIYVDMVSFVPMYEYQRDKKIFSRRTYNEIPAGFELRKNIHVKYKDPTVLNSIISVFSAAEIYDLVKVDYFAEKMDATRAELAEKSRTLLQAKLKDYKQLLGAKIDSAEKNLVEGYRVVYPVEMYRSYQAYAASEINMNKAGYINVADKSTTHYYQPVVNKEFDFVINPVILEPVIQVMYELRFEINRDKEIKPSAKQYLIITPSGEIKKLDHLN